MLAATIATTSTAATSTFANRSPLLAIGTDNGDVTVWDVSTPASPRRVHSFSDPRSGMYTVAFSLDDQILVGGGGDEVFWGWDLRRPDSDGALFDVSPHAGRTTDGRFLASGRFAGATSDGSVRLWTLDQTSARSALCALRGDALTATEWQRYLPGVDPFDPCRQG